MWEEEEKKSSEIRKKPNNKYRSLISIYIVRKRKDMKENEDENWK